jgi:hypothetical protein
MPLFTFYPYRSDGTALTFEVIDLASTLSATGHAQLLLAQHQSASWIEVWCGEELVLTAPREPAGVRAATAWRDEPQP